MKITVLTTTYRPIAQLEPRVESLVHQTFPATDFEWVIVDDHYQDHAETVSKWDTPFPLIHIPPRVVSEEAAGCAAINSGLVHARGDLVFTMADFIQPTQSSLERHWELFERYGPKVFISGPLVPFECPTCSALNNRQPALPDGAFVVPCQTGGHQMVILNARLLENWLPGGGEGEITTRGLMRQTFFVGRNDSIALEVILECNGMDESQDGYVGGMDIDLGMRLMNAGARYIIDRYIPVVVHPHVRGKTDAAARTIEIEKNRVTRAREVEAGRIWADMGWNIREERARLEV